MERQVIKTTLIEETQYLEKLKGLEKPFETYTGQIVKIIEFIEDHFRYLLQAKEDSMNTAHQIKI